MRNNKNISWDDIKVGMRVKIALPTTYVFHNRKDMHKKRSWWKGKVVEVNSNSFVVNLGWLGRMFITRNKIYRIVKCL